MSRLLPCLVLLCACRGGGEIDEGVVDAEGLVQIHPAEPVEAAMPEGWLWTDGNVIRTHDRQRWQGRGVNLPDTRGCGACMWEEPAPDEVMRRMDEAVEVWGATFVRLTLESYAEPADEWVLHHRSVLEDPDYLDDIEEIVDHAAALGVYILVSTWLDPTHTSQRHPTEETAEEWALLAERFASDGHVLFGVSAALQGNIDGAQDDEVWAAMDRVVAAIREVEDDLGTPHHLVSVSGTGGHGRTLDAYVERPIEAGGGDNVIYEMHVFTSPEQFYERDLDVALSLPMVVASFGPQDVPGEAPSVSLEDTPEMMAAMDELEIPWLAWTFHERCPPNLLVDLAPEEDCGVDMPLEPTAWGEAVAEALGDGG